MAWSIVYAEILCQSYLLCYRLWMVLDKQEISSHGIFMAAAVEAMGVAEAIMFGTSIRSVKVLGM